MARKGRAKKVGRRIRGVLEAKGWRKADLIVRSGLKQASVYEWLRGESEPRGEALTKLGRALEVSTDYLLGSDPTYDQLPPGQVAARESLRLCLRNLGIGPAHPEYLLYQELAVSEGAPKTVAAWRDFIIKLLPTVNEHLRARPRSREAQKAGRVFPLKAQGMPEAGEEEKESVP